MLWTRDREDRFEFYRLRYPDLNSELEQIDGFLSGQVDEDIEAELFSSASLNFSGALTLAEDDIVRIYYITKTDEGEERFELFTGFASTPSLSASSAETTGTLNLHSTLTVLQDDCFEATYQVAKGVNAISHASSIVSGCGLTVIAESSSAVTTEAKTFDASDSKLDIVKWLCEFASFSAPYTNEHGDVVLTSKTGTEGNLSPVYTFVDDEQSIMLGDVQIEREQSRVPNVVKLVYSSSSKTLTSTATNTSANSPFSLVNRGGRRVVHVETVSDVPGVSTSAQQSELDRLAKAELKKRTELAQSVTVKHAYTREYYLHQAVALDYRGAGISLTGRAVSRSIELEPGAMTTLRIKSGGE